MSGQVLVIGAGQAGLSVAQALRERGFAGGITLAGDEGLPPYQRPPLSKKYLAGDMSEERLALKPPAFYEMQGITLMMDAPITALDMARRVAIYQGGEIGFEHLVFATGTRPRRLSLPGMELPALPLPDMGLPGVHVLRSIKDVDGLRPMMQAGKRLVIIGAGYVGLEVAAVARARGLEVCVVEAAARVLSRVVSGEVSRFFEALHRGHGVEILTGAGVSDIRQGAAGLEVGLADGRMIAADGVLVAVGAVPNTELAASCGVETRDGIVVDTAGRTNLAGVYAAGDCTRFFSGRYDRDVRLESVQNAIDQARHVAGAIMGADEVYDPVPWFWSDQYDVKLQIAGLSGGSDTVLLRGAAASGAFSVFYLKDKRLLAVDAINRARDHMFSRKLIGRSFTGDAAVLADPDSDLNALFADQAGG